MVSSWANVSLPPATRNYPKLGGMYYQVNPSIWGGGKPAREGGPTSTFIPICRCFTKPKTRSLLAPLTLFEEHIGIDDCMLFIPTAEILMVSPKDGRHLSRGIPPGSVRL